MTAPLPRETRRAQERASPDPYADGPDDESVGPVRDFLRQHGAATGAGVAAVLVLAAAVVLFASGDDTPPPRRVNEFTIVNVVPPPPPPPPPTPPEPQQQPEPEMIEQPKMTDPEVKEEAKAEEPKEAPPADSSDEPPPGPLGLDQAADGPGDQFNLVGRPGGRGLLGGGGGGGGGSRWGWYASMVQQQIEAALRANAKTRNVVLQVQIRLWADGTGRVSRVQLMSSTGDPEIDALIRGEVFAGLTLREPPPADMPMPMVARISARRPS
jgi:outer membrane biosynthesis protein TonB